MAISINEVFNQVKQRFNDVDLVTFMDMLNEVDQDIQSNIRLVPQQQISFNAVYNQQNYALPDPAMMVWKVAWMVGTNAGTDLEPTTFDYLDYRWPGWRYAPPGIPAYQFIDAGNIGLYPKPNQATAASFPIIYAWVTEQPAPYLISGYLPNIVHSAHAWVYEICAMWAASYHPDRLEYFTELSRRARNQLHAYVLGRNVRRKQKVQANIPWVSHY